MASWRAWKTVGLRLALIASAVHGSAAEANASPEELVWPSSVEMLEQRLSAEDVEVRRRAARELARLPRAVQRRLLPPLFADPDAEVRLAVASAALSVRLPDAGALVVKWLSDSDARVREAAAEVSSVLRHPAAVARLGRVLSDPSPSVRAAAALALGNSRSPDATLFLLGHLDDSDPEVRRAVIAALEDLRDPRAVVPLIGRIQEQRAELRRQAAAALGTLGDSRAASALIVTLSDGDADVRAAAARAIGELRALDAVWSLAALLETEADPEVQAAIVDALGTIGTTASVEALLASLARPRPSPEHMERALARAGDVAVDGLERCIFHPVSPQAASLCVGVLGKIGGSTARRLVERALREGAASPVQALDALGAMGQMEALPTLLEYLTSSVPAERKVAVDAALRLLEPERRSGSAIDPIALALRRGGIGRNERAALIALMGRTGSPRAAPLLIPFAQGGEEYLRAVALEALGQLGPAGADRVLLDALDAPLFATRWTAAIALRRAGSRAALDELLDRLEAASPANGVTLATALSGPLGDSPGEAQVSRALALVEASAGPVKDALLEALARVPEGRATRALSLQLQIPERATRAKLAEVMGAHAQARDVLLPLMGDTAPIVRANAVWALGAIGGSRDLLRLTEAMKDRELAVAANAVAAIALLGVRHDLDVSEPLCAALEDARSYVQANALSGLRLTGAVCADREAPAWLLEHHHSEEVRLSAARLLRESAQWGGDRAVALDRCARKDVSGAVAAECLSTPARVNSGAEAATSSGPARHRDVEILVVGPGSDAPSPGAPYALVRADGLIRSGVSDRRGAVWEPAAPSGELRLAVPAVFAE